MPRCMCRRHADRVAKSCGLSFPLYELMYASKYSMQPATYVPDNMWAVVSRLPTV